MKKLTIILLSALIALSVLCYFQTTRAMLMQAVQVAATIRYARVHMAPTIVKMPFSTYNFTFSLPTLRWQRPHNQEHTHYYQQAHSEQPVYDDRPKKSPFPLLATAVLTLTNTVATASDDDKKQEQTKKLVQTNASKEIVQEAENVLKEVYKKLNISFSENLWESLSNETFENQDKILSALMEIIMNPYDKRSFKAVVLPGLQCAKLRQKHPELLNLIEKHFQKPKATEFLDQFNALEDSQLPPYFAQARIKICDMCDNLGVWGKAKIWWKF